MRSPHPNLSPQRGEEPTPERLPAASGGARNARWAWRFRLFNGLPGVGRAAIAAILSFSRAVEEGLRADAREILGGDVAVSLLYRGSHARAESSSRKSRGQFVRWIDSRAMARARSNRPAGLWSSSRRSSRPIHCTAPSSSNWRRHVCRCLGAKRDGVWGRWSRRPRSGG